MLTKFYKIGLQTSLFFKKRLIPLSRVKNNSACSSIIRSLQQVLLEKTQIHHDVSVWFDLAILFLGSQYRKRHILYKHTRNDNSI